MTESLIVTREEVKQALVDNRVMGTLGTSAPFEAVVDAFWSWLQDTIQNSLLPDIEHWALGPNGINTSALKIEDSE